MNTNSTLHTERRVMVRVGLAALGLIALCSTASAADKPPLAPDTVAPFSTESRISAAIEFGLPALAADVEKNIPRRLATIDERVSCVHRRILFFRVNANCDVYGFVDRSGPVSLYGRGDRVYGSVPIYGALEGQGANRFTARIHGETEASATVEAEARPELSYDWTLALNFSDGFRWSEPPLLHVMGREIPLSKYAEPRIRAQLVDVRERALTAVRRLNLHEKAGTAWRHAFDPVQLSENPEIWLQLTPRDAAFAGVRADSKILRGSLEFSGSAETVVGQHPAAVTPAPLPSLGHDVNQPGEFDVILPIRIGYDVLKDKITQAIAAMAPAAGLSVPDVEVYPSSGKLVVGLRVGKASDTDPNAWQWTYLAGALEVDAADHAVRLSDLSAASDGEGLAAAVVPIVSQLRDRMSIDYGMAYENLLNAANARLNRPLKDGFRMEGHLSSAKLKKMYLPADGIEIALRASGDLKILYGM
ncbi:DUF4403 family protein [Bradyrhizobium sp. CCGUVB1N3]|uniref:DUF4403 family protein n=1 Tax=Bradyrhizobium sp. CCGUVB1N3 TaxID=2949629 RepID=UPI0020B2839B|nr:DUF4403 family protein [Bradyrhizobium sp. CCGUVB1N3]MCP3476748.1 DUF4403 family protein [Bradyrhizobium sp. CCGUVB1N3]